MRRLLAVAALAVALCGCLPQAVVDTDPGGPFQPETLTDDGTDRFQLAGGRDEATVTAPDTNTGGNTRIVWTEAWAPASADQTVCATWASASTDVDQEGVLLRWDGTRGVTVTKGIYASVTTVINVHTWDVTRPEGDGRFTQVAQFPLTGLGWPSATAVPLPWRMCATAAGPTVRFKVWPLTMAEPADTDPCCTGGAPVPPGEGRPGWYAGHLRHGEHLTYTDLTTEAPP